MPSRRQLLKTLAVGTALAGCLDETGESDTTPTTETPAVLGGDCEATSHDWTDPKRDDVEPESLPEGPPEMSADAVESFVVAYEEAYLHNGVLEPNTESLGVMTGEVSVESRSYGFVVTLRSWYYHNVRGVTNGTETATRIHADSPHVWRRYAVTDSRLVRASGDGGGVKPDVSGGRVLECWET